MYLQLLAGASLFSTSLAMLVTPSASTSDATITPGPQVELLKKQNGDNYMGWISYSRGWVAESCDLGNTFYQSGNYWACCSTARAGCRNMPSQCISGNLIYYLSASTASGGSFVSARQSTIPCTSAYPDPSDQSFSICNTAYLYQNEDDNEPRTNVNCGVSSKNWSYYRIAPYVATARTSTPITTSTQPTTSVTTTTSSPTPVPPPSDDPKSESKAWIAGAVVGPVVGLALVGFLAWFFLVKRKKNNPPSAQQAAPFPNPNNDLSSPLPPTSPQPPQYYPPPMQQNPTQPGPLPGMVPYGVAKQDGWASSPQPSASSPLAPGQQWPQQGGSTMAGQPMYDPSPSTSPPPQFVQPAQYAEHGGVYKGPHTYTHEAGTFSNELEGNNMQHR